MKIVHPSMAVAVALALGTAFAQTNKPATAASAPTAADCRHDHGAEKGTAKSKSVNCGPAQKATAAASKPMHDHGKVHKQQ
jgi:hypothetical protein